MLFQSEKVAKTNDGDLTCHILSVEDAVAYMEISNPSRILTVEK